MAKKEKVLEVKEKVEKIAAHHLKELQDIANKIKLYKNI